MEGIIGFLFVFSLIGGVISSIIMYTDIIHNKEAINGFYACLDFMTGLLGTILFYLDIFFELKYILYGIFFYIFLDSLYISLKMFSNEYETYIKPYTRNYKKILYTIHKLNFTKKKRDIENQYIITIKAKPEKWIILNKIADILKTIFVITLLFLGVPLIWILVLLKLLIDNILETRSEKDGRITRIIKFIKEYWFFMFVVTIASKIIWPILTRIEQSHIQTISTFKNSTMT